MQNKLTKLSEAIQPSGVASMQVSAKWVYRGFKIEMRNDWVAFNSEGCKVARGYTRKMLLEVIDDKIISGNLKETK